MYNLSILNFNENIYKEINAIPAVRRCIVIEN